MPKVIPAAATTNSASIIANPLFPSLLRPLLPEQLEQTGPKKRTPTFFVPPNPPPFGGQIWKKKILKDV
jgi:hypothetical protein